MTRQTIKDTTPAKRITILPYSILLVVAFFCFVVFLVPVQRVWEQVKTPQMDIQPSGLQGTLWQGNADWVEWQDTAVQAVDWSFHPWALLRGVWEYQVNLNFDGALVTGYIGASLFGNLQGHDLGTKALLQDLNLINNNAQLALPAAVQGELQIQLDEVVLENQWISVLQGTAQLHDFGLEGLATLGDWQGRIYNDTKGNILLKFSPTESQLLGDGVFMLARDKKWTLTLKIKPAPTAIESDIAVLLSLLGTTDDQGYYVITQRGRLR
jgi:general secretion pathway protein N